MSRPCYRPRKIERPFSYIEEQFIKGNHLSSMEELNRRDKQFVDEWCNERHTTTWRIPNLHYFQEEKATLLPLPKKRYRMKELQSRIISPDSYISINSNKYSVPVQYVDKTMKFRIVYGFRIEIYDWKEKKVLTLEAVLGKHERKTNPDHYRDIAQKAATSIPQIRRDFTARYRNGMRYLEAAGKKFGQSTHHARKILLLEELYETDILDCFIGYAVDHDKMDIKSFKELLREYNYGKITLPELYVPDENHVAEIRECLCCDYDPALLRGCDYYERNVGNRQLRNMQLND